MPASLRSPATRSFGHLSITGSNPPAASASASATPAASERPLSPFDRVVKRQETDSTRLCPKPEIQPRPWRPRPAVWISAVQSSGAATPRAQALGEDRIGGVDRKAQVDRLGPQPRHRAQDPSGIEQIHRPRQGHRFRLDDQRDPQAREPFERPVEGRSVDPALTREPDAVPGSSVGQSPDDEGRRVPSFGHPGRSGRTHAAP